MAYNPISGFALQTIKTNGQTADGYYLKFYIANTTTPLSMAIDNTGGTLLVKAKLNPNGMPISNPLDNTTDFIPHMSQNYRLVIYTNETDADNNTTASAFVNIAEVSPSLSTSALSDLANKFGTVASMIANTDTNVIKLGNTVFTDGYTTAGDGGGATYLIESGTGDTFGDHTLAVAGLKATLQERVPSSLQYGFISNTGDLSNVAVLDALIANNNEVIISTGIYPNYDITKSNVTIHVDRGAVFKLPDNTTNAATTVPVPALVVSGDNVEFHGEIYIDGNFANNPSNAMDASTRIGAFHLKGANTRVYDSVKIENASWVSISAGSETDDAYNLEIELIEIVNSVSYATAFWSLDKFHIGSISITSGVDTVDDRIRTGSQNSSVKNCQSGTIDSIISTGPVVAEARTDSVHFGDVNAFSFKTEDNSNVTVDSIQVKDTTGTTFAFAVLTCDGFSCPSVTVNGYNGTVDKAVAISGPTNGWIGTIIVKGTVANATTDIEMRGAENFAIDTVICVDPIGNGRGFLFDYDVSYAPQKNIRIGRIISAGHTGLDVEVQSPALGDIIVGNINDDATTNLEYLKNSGKYEEGEQEVATTSGTGTVTLKGSQNRLTWTKIGRQVTLTGRIQVSAVSAPTGALTIESLPFPVADLGEEGERSGFYVFGAGLDTSFTTGTLRGSVGISNDSILIGASDGATEIEAASFMKANSVLIFNFSYFTD